MSRPVSRVAGRQVVSSGNIVAGMGETIEIIPFDGNNFTIGISYTWIAEGNATIGIVGSSQHYVMIGISKRWDGGISFAMREPIYVASNATTKYFIKFIFMPVGEPTDYSIGLMFNIYAEPIA